VILLDTHVWIWIAEGDARRIGPRARRLVQRAIASESVGLSIASVFEIVALHTSGRLRLAFPVTRWIDESIKALKAQVFQVTLDAAMDAGRIPRSALADPMDRLIVAAASDLWVPLLTCDRGIMAHAQATKSLRVEDASA
jgi:PIN domain nuclease of toxin-antitoxin system